MAKRCVPTAIGNRAPSTDERERIKVAASRTSKRPARVKVAINADELTPTHTDPVGELITLLDVFATRSRDFLSVNAGKLEAATRERGTSRDVASAGLNAGIALVQAIEPQNELESALAVQMAGTHAVATDLICMAKQAQSTEQIALFGNLAVKFERTFTMQLEALGRLRGKGQQTVRVEHVNVHPGAQAIVGDVHHHARQGGGQRRKSRKQAHGTAESAPIAALPGPDPTRDTMPIPSHAERPLQAPRRKEHGSTKGE